MGVAKFTCAVPESAALSVCRASSILKCTAPCLRDNAGPISRPRSLSASTLQRFNASTSPRPNAFTLLEIMIVVGIMGIILTMGVPIVYRAMHKAPMGKALADIVEVCSNARARAILGGHQIDVVFHPRDGRLEVGGAAVSPSQPPPPLGTPEPLVPPPAAGSGLSAQLGEGIVIRALGINMVDFTDAETARVRFFPNGTCDEMLMVINSVQNEQRGISLEITTALASVLSETELQQLRERLR